MIFNEGLLSFSFVGILPYYCLVNIISLVSLLYLKNYKQRLYRFIEINNLLLTLLAFFMGILIITHITSFFSFAKSILLTENPFSVSNFYRICEGLVDLLSFGSISIVLLFWLRKWRCNLRFTTSMTLFCLFLIFKREIIKILTIFYYPEVAEKLYFVKVHYIDLLVSSILYGILIFCIDHFLYKKLQEETPTIS